MFRFAVKTSIKSAILALFLFLPLTVLAQEKVRFGTAPLTIVTAGGQRHQMTAELALTPEQREHGLMYRKVMADDHGMLFDFGETRRVMMWMKNTVLALDMLFIDEQGVVTAIHNDAVPFSEAIIDSRGPIKFVLEINGGLAKRLGIDRGDRVETAVIGTPR